MNKKILKTHSRNIGLNEITTNNFPSSRSQVIYDRTEKITKIKAEEIEFLSLSDEETFFSWLDKIPCILKKTGVGSELHIYIDKDRVTETDLRDLIALSYRYNLDMKQLETFLNEENKSWFFDNKSTYWHREIFSHSREINRGELRSAKR